MTDIAGLLEKVRAATGPDREIDRYMMYFEGWRDDGLHMGEFRWITPSGQKTAHNPVDGPIYRYTSSVDAALALVERKLPGQHVTMGQNVHHHYWLCTFNHLNDEGAPASNVSEMHKSSLPLAILAALLSALSSGDAS